MKRAIPLMLISCILFFFAAAANAESPDWTLVSLPASEGTSALVFIDTDSMSDITTDINDNLYVMSGSRIMRFTSDGKLDVSWGNNGIIYDADIEKTWSEQLKIAADSKGYVYAECRICVDGSPTYIKRYSPDGIIDTSWYGDGVMGGKVGEEEILDDETESEEGICYQDDIALDSKDNLYVLYDRQVYRFLPDGRRDKSWRPLKMEQPQAEYDEEDSVWFPNALRIDRSDNIYLFNGYDRTVSKHDPSGKLKKKQKCALYYYDDECECYTISQIAFDPEGNIFYGKYEGDSILKYSPAFKLKTDWCERGTITLGGPALMISSYASDTKGNLYVLDEKNALVCKYNSDGSAAVEWGDGGSMGSVNRDGKTMANITDIVFDTDGSIYINAQIGYATASFIKFGADLMPDENWAAAFDMTGEWETGYDAAMAAYGGMLYVGQDNAGVQGSRVIRVNSGGQAGELGIETQGVVRAMYADKDGFIYIADSTLSVSRHTADGKLDAGWSFEGTVSDEYFSGMTSDPRGNLYVCKKEDNSVSRYTPGGACDVSWGEQGTIYIPGVKEDSYEDETIYIAADDACNLYVSDSSNNRILRYDSEGHQDTAWCDGGEWKSEETLAGSIMPLINPKNIVIYGGKLYAVWNDKLYVMSDSAAMLGTKQEDNVAPNGEPVKEPLQPASSPEVKNETDNWPVIIAAGAVALLIGAVITVILLRKKKAN